MEKTEGRRERPLLGESLKGFLGEFKSIKTSRWKIVISYFYLGTLSAQVFVNYIHVLRKFFCSLHHHGISLNLTDYVWLPPVPRHPSSLHPPLISSLLLLPTCWNYRRFHCIRENTALMLE